MYNGDVESLFVEHANDVYRFLVYFTGKRDVEDLVQETFLKLLRYQNSYRDIGSRQAWLFRVARNVALDAIRKQKNTVSIDESHVLEKELLRTVEDVVETRDRQALLTRSIQKLKSDFRCVVILRSIHGLSVKETATSLGWTEAKVRTTHHRGMKELQKMLMKNEDGGVDCGMA